MNELREFTNLGQIQMDSLIKMSCRNRVTDWIKAQLIPYFLSDKYKGNDLVVRQVHEFEPAYKSELYGTGTNYYLVNPDLEDIAYWKVVIDYLNTFDRDVRELKSEFGVTYIKRLFTNYYKECGKLKSSKLILVHSINYAWFEINDKPSLIYEMVNLGKYILYEEDNNYISLRNVKGKCFVLISFNRKGKYINNIICDKRTCSDYEIAINKIIKTLGLNLRKADILRDDY